MRHRFKLLSAGALALPLVAAVSYGTQRNHRAARHDRGDCRHDEAEGTEAAGECTSVDDVRLQLQWVYQSQFAGYLAAVSEGFYEARCLNVEILEGGVDIVPQTVLANGEADFAISWVPKALASREAGADIVNIAQIFQRSGTLQVSLAATGITSPEDFEGHTIGNWGFGNEYEVFAALGQAGLDPASDVELVQQNFDMVGLLDGSIDAAEAMTYNEYAQVLEAVNPETGELYTPDDLSVISYEEIGVGMLQDAIWADGARLGDDAYVDVADPLRRRVDRGLGVLSRQPGRMQGHRDRVEPDPPRQPPALADERDQQAHLAGRGGHRLHQRGRLEPHRRDRTQHAEPRRRHGADG